MDGTVIAAGDPISTDWDTDLKQLATPPADRLRPENLSNRAYCTPDACSVMLRPATWTG